MTERERIEEIQIISKKISKTFNKPFNIKTTGTFQKITKKVDSKWEITLKVEKGLSDFFEKKLKEHSFLEKRSKDRDLIFEMLDGDISYINRKEIVKEIIIKASVISTVQGGGAAIAGAPFTLVETFIMMNALWHAVEKIAVAYDIEPYSYFEKVYILRIITIALTDERLNKVKIYKELMNDEHLFKKEVTLMEQFDYIDAAELSKSSSKSILAPLVSSKLAQTIPMVGFTFGGATNVSMIKSCLNLADLIYRRRFLDNEIVD